MSIQVSSPAMPNVVTSGCWLAGASRPVDYQASQGAHQRPKGPPHHLYRHPANRPSLPAGGFNGDARVLWVIADTGNLAGKAACTVLCSTAQQGFMLWALACSAAECPVLPSKSDIEEAAAVW